MEPWRLMFSIYAVFKFRSRYDRLYHAWCLRDSVQILRGFAAYVKSFALLAWVGDVSKRKKLVHSGALYRAWAAAVLDARRFQIQINHTDYTTHGAYETQFKS